MSYVDFAFSEGCARITLTDGDRGNPIHTESAAELFVGGLSIAGVLDWEMATLGDPLTDVASMAVWWDGSRGLDSPIAAVPGEQLDISFAFFKLAATFEGIHYRFVQGQTVGDGFDRIGGLVGPMIEAGHRELDGENDRCT